MTRLTWSVGLGVVVALGVLPLARLVPASAAEQGKKTARGLKFEVYRDAAENFRWRLKASNGQVIGTPAQGYKTKADCRAAVDLIRREAGTDRLKFEVYQDAAGAYRWRLKSGNGQIVGTSGQGYKARADCEHAVDVIKKGAAEAEVVDEAAKAA